MSPVYLTDATQIFTLFFVMLGPLGVITPFAQATQKLDPQSLRILAFKSIGLASLTLAMGGFLGCLLLEKWKVSTPVMLLTGGIIFFLVALRANMRPYEVPPPQPVSEAPLSPPTAASIAFPNIVTPFGMATVIVLVAASQDISRTTEIYGLLVTIMLLNLLTMIFARKILKMVGTLSLKILFAAVGVLQMALAVQIIVLSIQAIKSV